MLGFSIAQPWQSIFFETGFTRLYNQTLPNKTDVQICFHLAGKAAAFDKDRLQSPLAESYPCRRVPAESAQNTRLFPCWKCLSSRFGPFAGPHGC